MRVKECHMLPCSKYNVLKAARTSKRARFMDLAQRTRPRITNIALPEHLQGPFSKFTMWLTNHIRRLRHDNFPIPMAILNLAAGLDHVAYSFHSMWAYGAHYRCDNELDGPSHVTFHLGIAHITDTTLASNIDVGILRNILMVNFGSTSFVLMEGSWIAARHQERANVKKDCYGFWTVGFGNRQDAHVKNPYAFPETISQVFFIDDTRDPNMKVVLRHEPRAKRTSQENDAPFFGAYGADDGALVIPHFNNGLGIGAGVRPNPHIPGGAETVIQGQAVGVVDANTRIPDTDAVYNDVDHEDELEVDCGDV
jgi:hypothetical protein